MVTGTLRDYLAIEGPQKSRNSCWLKGGSVGAHEQFTQGANWRNPRTKYKRSKNVFAVTIIALSLGLIWARLLELPGQSLIGSPGTPPQPARCVPPEERLPSGAPKEEFGQMIFQKKSSLGNRTKVPRKLLVEVRLVIIHQCRLASI